MKAHIEIYRDEEWRRLVLRDSVSVKYNAVINKIGVLSTREISHTDTFSLPFVSKNIESLGLNLFNKLELAQTLNSKFKAKYYIGDKLFREGYLLINNTNDNEINVNFVDDSLNLVEKWGDYTFQEFMNSEEINFPPEYQTVIDLMKDYSMNPYGDVESVPKPTGKDYHMALFPNNLNTIGDKFQRNKDDIRFDDAFNPFQSRPIFNIKAFLDLVTESFGYDPIYDTSIDWSVIENTYMVANGLNKNYQDNVLDSYVYGSIGYDPKATYESVNNGSNYDVYSVFNFSSDDAIKPDDIVGWYNPLNPFNTNYEELYCVLPLNVQENYSGKVVFKVSTNTVDTDLGVVKAVYRNPISLGILFINQTVEEVKKDNGYIEFSLDKWRLELGVDYLDFVGILPTFVEKESSTATSSLISSSATETSYIGSSVIFDKWGQYSGFDINLLHAAPNVTLKKLLSGIMQQQGILINIDSKEKEVRFFGYGRYLDRKRAGDFHDWSKYLRRHNAYSFNTDYGEKYAKNNKISLKEPYLGNYGVIKLANQTSETKYKTSADNEVDVFKDVEEIISVENSNVPYFEYTNKGVGLVQHTGNLDDLHQVRAEEEEIPLIRTVEDLPAIANYNYLVLPQSLKDWYGIVDLAVRAIPEFLIPTDIVADLDLSIPVFINDLGGFYIIEVVEEYINSSTLVRVKLLKLLELGGFSDGFSNGFNN